MNPAGITCQAATFPTIAGAVVATKDFSTLLAGVQAAGLVPTLSDPMFAATVFAPTNAVGTNAEDVAMMHFLCKSENSLHGYDAQHAHTAVDNTTMTLSWGRIVPVASARSI